MNRDPNRKIPLTGNFRVDCERGAFRVDATDAEFQGLYVFMQMHGPARDDGQRMDAGETAMITRQLLYIKARTYDIKYPTLRARDFIPASHEVPTSAEQWSYWSWDMIGMAKIVVNYATDFPAIEALKRETIQGIKSVGDSYAYTVQDMRRIAFTAPQGGGQLDVKKASMARRAIEQSIDDLAAVGSPDAGFTGFVNNPNVPVFALPTGSWATATALQIIGDMNALVQKVITQTIETEHPDVIVMPDAEFSIVSQTPFSTLSNHTIATWFTENNPYIGRGNGGLDQWPKLRNQNAAGNGGRLVAYRRDPEVLTLEIPQEFEQFAPQLEGLEYTIPCHARFGGVAWYYPLAGCYGDGSS